MNDLAFSLLLLVITAAFGAGCFYAGYRAAAAYLPAARAVAQVSAVAVSQANGFAASLDKTEASLTSLKDALDKNTETLEIRHQAVEDALLSLFQGLERAGLARSSSSRAAPRQVGEPPAA